MTEVQAYLIQPCANEPEQYDNAWQYWTEPLLIEPNAFSSVAFSYHPCRAADRLTSTYRSVVLLLTVKMTGHTLLPGQALMCLVPKFQVQWIGNRS